MSNASNKNGKEPKIELKNVKTFRGMDVNWEYETQRIIKLLRETGALMAYIDLFCGAGGTSTGMEEAEYNGKKLAECYGPVLESMFNALQLCDGRALITKSSK